MNDFFNKIFPYPENVPSDDCEFFFNDNEALKKNRIIMYHHLL